jgi:hypothetical protein
MKIIAAQITKMPQSLFDPMPQVIAEFEDGTIKTLFSYYPDEISFTPDEFIGLSYDEAIALFHKKDVKYLRS